MSKPVVIPVAKILESPLCITGDDGRQIYAIIEWVIESNARATVSFDDCTMFIPLFLSASIGKLYKKYNEGYIKSHIDIVGLNDDGKELLKVVIGNAKKYYDNPEAYDLAWEEEV